MCITHLLEQVLDLCLVIPLFEVYNIRYDVERYVLRPNWVSCSVQVICAHFSFVMLWVTLSFVIMISFLLPTHH